MNAVKPIRERLKLTQQALADGIGCSQGNIWQLERTDKPQALTSPLAISLIGFCREQGLHLSMDQVYGFEPLPEAPKGSEQPQPAQPSQESTDIAHGAASTERRSYERRERERRHGPS
jgi:putative transcriptional regulator